MIYVGVPTCVWAGAGNKTFHLPEDDFYRHKSWTPLSSQAHSLQLTFILYCNGALSLKFTNNIAINGYFFNERGERVLLYKHDAEMPRTSFRPLFAISVAMSR